MRPGGLLLGAMLASCAGTGNPTADAPDTFLAFTNTFAAFRSQFHSFHSDGPADDGTFPADVLGPRTQYINNFPASGAKEFPVGTVIVESRENGSGKIFAAVKRGGGFNATGAVNWEWFEDGEDASTKAVSITWRGLGPPLGDTYGGDPNGGCNACHMKCGANNDFVCSGALQLSNF